MHSLWCTINILWSYNKFDILLSESPEKSDTQDELELQRYLLDKSNLEKTPLIQISTIISYCKTCVSSTGNIRSFGEDFFHLQD